MLPVVLKSVRSSIGLFITVTEDYVPQPNFIMEFTITISGESPVNFSVGIICY